LWYCGIGPFFGAVFSNFDLKLKINKKKFLNFDLKFWYFGIESVCGTRYLYILALGNRYKKAHRGIVQFTVTFINPSL